MNNKILKVLVVEDALIAQMTAKTNLTDLSCEVGIASSGKEVLDLTKENNYDIIFMDLGLDDMDGYEVTEKIRSQHGKNDRTTIIALTAHSIETVAKRCREVGFDDFITKPLSFEVARKVINEFRSKN